MGKLSRAGSQDSISSTESSSTTATARSNAYSVASTARGGGPGHVSASFLNRVVGDLLDEISRGFSLRSKLKECLYGFYNFYFEKGPHTMTEGLVRLLLIGDHKRKGLVQSCGFTSNKSRQIKNSAALSLRVITFLCKEDGHDNSPIFIDIFANLGPELHGGMKLERHILEKRGCKEDAFFVIGLIRDSDNPVPLDVYVKDPEARTKYEAEHGIVEVPVAQAAVPRVSTVSLGRISEMQESNAMAENASVRDDDVQSVRSNANSVVSSMPARRDSVDNFAMVWDPTMDDSDSDSEGEGNTPLQETSADDATKPHDALADPLGMGQIWKLMNQSSATQLVQVVKQSSRSNLPHQFLKRQVTGQLFGNAPSRQKIKRASAVTTLTAGDKPHVVSDEIVLTSENFNPKTYLREVHNNTNLSALQEGIKNLEHEVNSQTTQLKHLVRDNIIRFLNCKDQIDGVYTDLNQHSDKTGRFTRVDGLKERYDVLGKMASSVYQELLNNKAETDRIRGVMDTLNRFRFLFNLPGILRDNITKGEIERVVRDYKKAQSLMASSNVKILSWLHEEIETIVGGYRESLFKQLEDPLAYVEDQERIVLYLAQLGCKVDPAWYYLTQTHDRICKILSKAGTGAGLDNRIECILSSKSEAWFVEQQQHLNALVKSRARSTSHNSHRSNSVTSLASSFEGITLDRMMPVDEDEEGAMEDKSETEVDGNKSLLVVQGLTTILIRNLPALYRLVSNYQSGKYASDEASGMSDANKSDEGEGEEKDSVHDAAALVDSVVSCYSVKVRALFGDLASGSADGAGDGDGPGLVMDLLKLSDADAKLSPELSFQCAMEIQTCLKSLQNAKIPSSSMNGLLLLTDDMIGFAVMVSFRNAVVLTRQLHMKEDWVISDLASKAKDSPVARITALPLRFRQLMLDSAMHLQNVSQNLDNMSTKICIAFHQAVRIFADCFHYLAFSQERRQELELTGPQDQVGQCEKLFIILGNVLYTRSMVLPELLARTRSISVNIDAQDYFSQMEMSDTLECLSTLEKMLVERYVAIRTEVLNDMIRNGMVLSGMDWMTTIPPKEVRHYVMELLHQLVMVHNSICVYVEPRGGEKTHQRMTIITALVSNIVQMYLTCLRQLDNISPMAAFQIEVELDFIEQITAAYHSERTQVLFRRAAEYVMAVVKRTVATFPDNLTMQSETQRNEMKQHMLKELLSRCHYNFESLFSQDK